MQLTVRDVCHFLNVSESTLTRWIKQRGLPFHHVGGQDRFNRAELLEWATANQVKVSAELFDHLETDDEPTPTLAAALERGGVHRLQVTEKNQALRSLVDLLPLPDGIDREEIFQLFRARESLTSTAVGNGIALPHVRNPIVLHVDHPMVTLCFLDNPIDFGAMDGKPVSVLFSLICPTTRSHLQLLSRLSHALRDEKFMEVLTRQGEREEILRETRRVEGALGSLVHGAGKGNR